MDAVEQAIAAIRAGEPVILPTDTVYGLCTTPNDEEPVRQLAKLKGRDEGRPVALVAADVDVLFECVPELRGRAAAIARALLPGPYTLVLANPARRFRWLGGRGPTRSASASPEFPPEAVPVFAAVGAVAATSANPTGGPDPAASATSRPSCWRRALRVVDAGELPGTASTVIDFTTDEPHVLREGAAPAAAAIERALAALA